MKLLLDTHIVIWALSSPSDLRSDHREAIKDPTNQVIVSAMCIAEMAIKSSIDKLTIDSALEKDGYRGLIDAITTTGFDFAGFSVHDAGRLRELPLHHRDPFDRMIIAQALNLGATVVTVDAKFGKYDVALL